MYGNGTYIRATYGPMRQMYGKWHLHTCYVRANESKCMGNGTHTCYVRVRANMRANVGKWHLHTCYVRANEGSSPGLPLNGKKGRKIKRTARRCVQNSPSSVYLKTLSTRSRQIRRVQFHRMSSISTKLR